MKPNQNAFVRLKNTKKGLIDPGENRATAYLALCLSVSVALRRAFLEFLTKNESKAIVEQAGTLRIETEFTTPRHGRMDLVITDGVDVFICVEFKIGTKESPEQYCSYRDYLASTKYKYTKIYGIVNALDRSDIYKGKADERYLLCLMTEYSVQMHYGIIF